MSGITLLGLGPGTRRQITREAWEVLSGVSEVWLRTRQLPVVARLPAAVALRSFDDLYENATSADAIAASIIQQVLELGRRPEGVIYAVPGHPLIVETTGSRVFQCAEEEGLEVRVVGGVSLLEAALSALPPVPLSRLAWCDALAFGTAHAPPFPPDAPALIIGVQSRVLALSLQRVLKATYPDSHPVCLIHSAGTPKQAVEELALGDIERDRQLNALTCLFLPPLEPGSSLEALQEVVAHLRAPDGCPWDREQTHASLRRHLLEEAFEVVSAIDGGSAMAIREELGDLLLQIFLNSQIAGELGEFTLNDVARGIHDKIVRRHPHVFGDVTLDGVESVLVNWEKLKETERDGKEDPGGLLDGVPLALPALSQAQEYQERAARVGFDWPEIRGVLDKIVEEIREVEDAVDAEALEAELGDLLFALVNLSRWKAIDAESALRGANIRFKNRFGYIEQTARARQQRLSDMTLAEMEVLWDQAKKSGR